MGTWASVKLLTGGHPNTVRYGSDDKGNITAEYSETYGCLANDDWGGQPPLLYAETASDGLRAVPTIGAWVTVDGQSGWRVTGSVPARTEENPFYFTVENTYTIKFGYQPTDTTKWNIDIEFDGKPYEQTCYHAVYAADMDGISSGSDGPVVNSAQQTFNPQPTRTFFDEEISVSYTTLTPPDLTDFRGYLNSDTVSFTIRGIGKSYSPAQLLLENGTIATSVLPGSGETPVWQVKLKFWARTGTYGGVVNDFTVWIIDQGFYTKKEVPADSGTYVQVAQSEAYGRQMNEPILLDGMGNALALADPSTAITPVYRKFYFNGFTALSSLFDGLA